MTRTRVLPAALVAVLLGGALLVGTDHGRTPGVDSAVASPVAPAAPSTSTPVPPRAGTVTGLRVPPAGTIATPSRYLERYDARRVGWDDLLARGRAIPRPDATCTDRWRGSGKDAGLEWGRGRYWCLDKLRGAAWLPQGVAGSGTTEGYRIGGRAAADRNLVLTSWYSRADERGLFADNRRGESVTRLVVMDLDRGRYNVVELVRPEGSSGLRNLNSHGSGLAWAGQYLYSSSLSSLWMFNADDLLEIDGRFVLPAVTRWGVSGGAGLSSISLARSAGQDQIKAINYTRTGRTYVQAFGLDQQGLLTAGPQDPDAPFVLTNRFGEGGRVVRSIASSLVPGSHFQGIGRWKPYSFANSSALRHPGPTDPRVDAMVVLRDGREVKRFQMPRGNVESIYIDYRRRTYVSLTEHRSQFLFTLPLGHLLDQTGR